MPIYNKINKGPSLPLQLIAYFQDLAPKLWKKNFHSVTLERKCFSRLNIRWFFVIIIAICYYDNDLYWNKVLIYTIISLIFLNSDFLKLLSLLTKAILIFNTNTYVLKKCCYCILACLHINITGLTMAWASILFLAYEKILH